ncbi:hypothetical protein H072_512 [Dactylellina haptotyla CBS 200.50]|uniref:DJ-1/PfpI domain-containing protein n=1 Tax=Dactylellina haptotyla (strain CBS 200.50) TaxID=1284197 RepID=S8AR79_DACHA|nr:hypothetical protein H072_512 [Dactylellina haptotyla CBS 200.50]
MADPAFYSVPRNKAPPIYTRYNDQSRTVAYIRYTAGDVEDVRAFDAGDAPSLSDLLNLSNEDSGIMLLVERRNSVGTPLQLSSDIFHSILELIGVPATYVRLFDDNNGVTTNYVSRDSTGAPKTLYLFVKLPQTSILESAIFLRYDYKTRTTKCIVIGSHTDEILDILPGVLRSGSSDDATAIPMLILSTLTEIYSSLLDRNSSSLDRSLVRIELGSGITTHFNVGISKTSPEEYRDVMKIVHQLAVEFAQFEFYLGFQIKWIKALKEHWGEFKVLLQLSTSAQNTAGQPIKGGNAQPLIEMSLDILTEKAYNRLQQFKSLHSRLQIQERVLNSFITATDAFTTISLAHDAKANSDSMKTIAIVTILFLPGAYVSSIFGMSFFDVSDDKRSIYATKDWWIFIAVTIPLTVVVMITAQQSFMNLMSRIWTGGSKSKTHKERSATPPHPETSTAIRMDPIDLRGSFESNILPPAGGSMYPTMKSGTLLNSLRVLSLCGTLGSCATNATMQQFNRMRTMSLGIIAYPGFEPLDIFGPLEAFYSASGSQVKITLSIIGYEVGPVSAKPPTGVIPPGTTEPLDPGWLAAPSIYATHTFHTAPALDILLVPGGTGDFYRDGYKITDVEDFIRARYPALNYLLSVCSGAVNLARAGVLNGKRATTNKALWQWATDPSRGKNITWVPAARWVTDGNIWTSSGVSAGLDMTYAFMKDIYGATVANNVYNGMEYAPHQDPNWDPFAIIHNVPGADPRRPLKDCAGPAGYT